MNGFRAETVDQINRFLIERTVHDSSFRGDMNVYVYSEYGLWAIRHDLHVFTRVTFIGVLKRLGETLVFEEGRIPGNARPGRWKGLRIVSG